MIMTSTPSIAGSGSGKKKYCTHANKHRDFAASQLTTIAYNFYLWLLASLVQLSARRGSRVFIVRFCPYGRSFRRIEFERKMLLSARRLAASPAKLLARRFSAAAAGVPPPLSTLTEASTVSDLCVVKPSCLIGVATALTLESRARQWYHHRGVCRSAASTAFV